MQMAPRGPIKSSYFCFLDLFWRSQYIVHMYKFKLKFTHYLKGFSSSKVLCRTLTLVLHKEMPEGQSRLLTMFLVTCA